MIGYRKEWLRYMSRIEGCRLAAHMKRLFWWWPWTIYLNWREWTRWLWTSRLAARVLLGEAELHEIGRLDVELGLELVLGDADVPVGPLGHRIIVKSLESGQTIVLTSSGRLYAAEHDDWPAGQETVLHDGNPAAPSADGTSAIPPSANGLPSMLEMS